MPTVRKILFSMSVMLIAFLFMTGFAYAATVKTGIITGDVVNMRANPNTSAKIIKQLEKGTKVSVVGSEGDWFKVSYSDSTGWINDDYVTIRNQSISAGTVNGSVVNVRSKPDVNSEILTKLEKGTKVDIYEQSGDWYRISIGEDRYGWVNGEFISVRSETVSRGLTTDVKAPVPAEAADEENEEAAKDADTTEKTDDKSGEKSDDIRQQVVEYAKKFLGVKYVYGKSSPSGFDCSGFVSYVFKNFDIKLERASRDMGKGGKAVKKADLQPGDLVFFDTNGGLNGINHVGIYIGSNKFIHASSGSGRKVMISSLSDSFYVNKFMRARDYLSK